MRDVEEHFEHTRQEKAKDHENNLPRHRQPSSSSSSSTGLVEFRPERHYHYGHSKIGPSPGPGLQDISNVSPFGISFGSAQIGRASEDEERPGTVSPDQLPTVLEGDEAKTELYADSEDDDGGSIPITSPSSSGSVEEPPKFRAEEYSERSSAGASNDFDYGGFEETSEDDNSSFGTSATYQTRVQVISTDLARQQVGKLDLTLQ
jgi:hypothetical protein